MRSPLLLQKSHLTMTSFLLHLILSLLFSEARGYVKVGDSLTAAENSSSWLSPSGDFAFGFHSVENSKDLFLLAIWYAKIPEKTIIWYTNEGVLVPKDSKVELNSTQGLVLTDDRGNQLWVSPTQSGVVASGSMTDSGNLVLQGSSSETLWESFKHPADTILPEQVLDRGMILNSRRSEANFSKGRFQLRLQQDGNLVLTTINLPSTYANEPYYESGTKGESNISSPGYQLVFNSSGYLYVLRENNQTAFLSQRVPPRTDYYHRATIDFDGVFTQYYYPKSSASDPSWASLWSIPDNICLSNRVTNGSGTCGYNSICILQADGRPSCHCPGGYSLLDPNDSYGSCRANYTQGCGEDEEGPVEKLYGFEELSNVGWPGHNYARLQPFTEEQCRQSCLHDCMCFVVGFREGDRCWKKTLPLSNGRLDAKIEGKVFIKVRRGNPRDPYLPASEKNVKNKDDNKILIGSVLLGCSAFINFLLLSALCLGFFFIYRRKLKGVHYEGSVVDTNLRCFTYNELLEATDGFKEELGRGAFGVVYKGALLMGSGVHVAVKKLHHVLQDGGLKEFKTEVNVIGQIHHKNLVRLLGFCDEGEQRLLVYEYLSNGALSSFLFGDKRPRWNERIPIVFGIARGLLYLHEECSTQIIHCDIKPQNILLDDYYNARISDFGLAKLLALDQSQSQTLTAIRGTKGYVAPEWFRNMPVTVKVDVYSFGVLLLEIICCRRSVDPKESTAKKAILIDWAYDCYIEGSLDALVEYEPVPLKDIANLERFVMIAIWCVQEDPLLRPNMRQVTQMLEGVCEVPVPPVTSHSTL